MTKQYDTQEQIDAFDIYIKQNPAGRQVHHTGTLGYDDDEWKAFQEGWNAALAKPVECMCGICKLGPAQEQEESLELFEYWNAVEGWVKIDEVRKHFGSVGCGTIYKTAGEDRVPVYTTPPKRPWVGLTQKEVQEIHDTYHKRMGPQEFAQAIEAKLKEKNT